MDIQKLRNAILEELRNAEEIYNRLVHLESITVPMTKKMFERACWNITDRFSGTCYEPYSETDEYIEFQANNKPGTLVNMMEYGDLVTGRSLGSCGSIDYIAKEFKQKFEQIKSTVGRAEDLIGEGPILGASPFEYKHILAALSNLYGDLRENTRNLNTTLKYVWPYKDSIDEVSAEFCGTLDYLRSLTQALPHEPNTINYFGSNRTNRVEFTLPPK